MCWCSLHHNWIITKLFWSRLFSFREKQKPWAVAVFLSFLSIDMSVFCSPDSHVLFLMILCSVYLCLRGEEEFKCVCVVLNSVQFWNKNFIYLNWFFFYVYRYVPCMCVWYTLASRHKCLILISWSLKCQQSSIVRNVGWNK